ncbi:helix-turn-helix domain-containing protein [Planomonospora venezuelensis]|uniref:Transcriptional regulator with XRE-family HTH domain n=1 Tax=Planomonospora venezuelensis TaxID=1999 RepID=A0A841D494_PLAVE|nr:helix-turn-helix transcriptional regulator [Planomonospora venezuelensis]MBB5963208.1 transcriptional regulator with XRE-family HTH domain [Planomonospora venezuelensis]GIN03927.1 transcriptional regulator [Planomonospora venezuelensis]
MGIEPVFDPGSPRVRFGAEMRRMREEAQLSQAAVAARLGCTQTQVSRLEAATRTPSKADAEKLDLLFGSAGTKYFTRLYRRILSDPGGPVRSRTRVEEIESAARVLRSWDPLLVPGLLQTESYVRHLLGQGGRSAPGEADERVQARLRRRRVLDRDRPPLILALIDPGVLRRPVGGPAVMREQLGHLLEAARRPSVFVQIVDPACLAGLAGSFVIAEFPGGRPDSVHVDSPVREQATDEHDVVDSVWSRYEEIRLWARPERESLGMIEEARREWV